ncbi:MAG: HPr family phosphocarrier protein [Lachnospiraceae bacterium]|nr:HPr family phosphocarrier protein [Lachnospiraceae bacterium]
MTEFNYTITDEVGIHARPAGLLVKEVKQYDASIKIECGGKSADANKLMAIMGLGVKKGDTVKVTVDGDDELLIADKLEKFFKENL